MKSSNENEVAVVATAAASSVLMIVGYSAAILSAVFNGSFTSGFKLRKVASCNLHPVWFTVYVSTGVVVSSWVFGLLLLPWNDWAISTDTNSSVTALNYEFEPLGLVAGSLFVLAIAFSFAAIDHIGVALGQGLWSGCAILVSFLWGTWGFHDPCQSIWIAVLALCLLTCGVMMIAFCESLSVKYTNNNDYEMIPEVKQHQQKVAEEDILTVHSMDVGNHEKLNEKKNEWIGYICVLAVGVFGGSILVPLQYVPIHRSGFVFLPSFGCGVLVSSPIVALIWLCCLSLKQPPPPSLHREEEETQQPPKPAAARILVIPPLHLHPCLWVGMISGMIWNFGNILAIIAIPRIGYAIAYPILNCALFVSGLLGIFIFKEISNRISIVIFFIGGLVLLSGAILLSVNSSGGGNDES